MAGIIQRESGTLLFSAGDRVNSIFFRCMEWAFEVLAMLGTVPHVKHWHTAGDALVGPWFRARWI